MKYLIGLKRPHDSFFDPETRLYLHFYNPKSYVDRISQAIERGLKGGTLVNLTSKNQVNQEETPAVAEEKTETVKEVVETKKEKVETKAVVPNEQAEEIDLSQLTKAELLEYIKEKGMDLKDLGVSKNASAAKIREALEAYLAK
jgi:hypothetical protein